MTYPPDFTHPLQKTLVAHQAAASIAGLAPAHRAVVQAGGCSGLWPLALAAHFAQVVTFEPEPANFACLRANVASAPNVSAFDYAIGDTRGMVGVTRPKAQAGLWRVDGEGEIPMVTLDEFVGDLPVDAIVLDVEGHEVLALRGAERLIETHRPLLWFEYLNHRSAINDFLAAHDYTPPAHALGGDCYSVHVSRVQ